MNQLAAVASLVATLALAACSEVTTPEDTSAASAGLVRPEALVGTWRFDLGEERRDAIYAEIDKTIADPAQRKQRKLDIEAEAEASLLVFDRNGVFHSIVLDKELVATPYTAKPTSATSILVSTDGGKVRTIDFVGADTIVVRDPKKGGLTYHRE